MHTVVVHPGMTVVTLPRARLSEELLSNQAPRFETVSCSEAGGSCRSFRLTSPPCRYCLASSSCTAPGAIPEVVGYLLSLLSSSARCLRPVEKLVFGPVPLTGVRYPNRLRLIIVCLFCLEHPGLCCYCIVVRTGLFFFGFAPGDEVDQVQRKNHD